MKPLKHELLLTLILTLALASLIIENVSASYFFDDTVTLRWKSDPALRSVLARTSLAAGDAINVVLTLSDVTSGEELMMLRSLGNIKTFTGHVATMKIPRETLEQVASLYFVQRISIPRRLTAQLDVSVPGILADEVWTTVKDSSGNSVNGTGVIVGIIDSGIDYQHKDFYFANGTSKILYIWDQSSDGRSPKEFDYGNECDNADIRNKSCKVGDPEGHGTAVAAIAASTGEASKRFYGVAPGASIVFVKLRDMTDNYFIDAMNYVIDKARELGRPVVIDHSYGDVLGSHDGTEPLELAMDDLASKGVPIVVSAGNERNRGMHVSGNIKSRESVTVTWEAGEGEAFSLVDLWYPASDSLTLSLRTPWHQLIQGPTPDAGVHARDANIIILADQRGNGKEWWINVTSLTRAPLLWTEPWSFTLTRVRASDGRWDAWTEPGNFTRSQGTIMGQYTIDPTITIDYPGTAKGVITVGSYAQHTSLRTAWHADCTICISHQRDAGTRGFWWSPVATADGNLTFSSGAGPTRDGRIKPEITAPGGNIATARSKDKEQRFSDPDDFHQVFRGSSFAAPHVVGVIALMLQMNAYLSPNQIKEILTKDTQQDDFTGKTPNNFWGWGKLNALTSSGEAPTLYSVKLEISSDSEGFSTEVTLDGVEIATIGLNSLETMILEFRRDGNHTLELTPVIDIGKGARYVVDGTPWTFSSGGVREFQYRLQYFLLVASDLGNVTGGGWYDAGSIATVSVSPTSVLGFEFQGWKGSVNSSSPRIQLEMNSSKELFAQWQQAPGPTNVEMPNLIPVLVMVSLLVGLAVVIVVLRIRRRPEEIPMP